MMMNRMDDVYEIHKLIVLTAFRSTHNSGKINSFVNVNVSEGDRGDTLDIICKAQGLESAFILCFQMCEINVER